MLGVAGLRTLRARREKKRLLEGSQRRSASSLHARLCSFWCRLRRSSHGKRARSLTFQCLCLDRQRPPRRRGGRWLAPVLRRRRRGESRERIRGDRARHARKAARKGEEDGARRGGVDCGDSRRRDAGKSGRITAGWISYVPWAFGRREQGRVVERSPGKLLGACSAGGRRSGGARTPTPAAGRDLCTIQATYTSPQTETLQYVISCSKRDFPPWASAFVLKIIE